MRSLGSLLFLLVLILLTGVLFFQVKERGQRGLLNPKEGPVPITLPSTLKRLKVSVEPSGLTWSPRERRFFLVSDDFPRFKKRVFPCLYALTLRGALTSPPIKVISREGLADLEGLASDGEGTFYLLCSQSVSPKGRLPRKRTCFFEAVLKRHKLYVKTYLYLRPLLAEFFESLSPEERKEVFGFKSPKKFARLNLEGLVFRDGDLYLGVSSPTVKGRALIWKIEGARKFFAQPDPARSFRLWRRVETDGEGISGLAFLSDGTLVFLTGTKKGGSLWVVPREALSSRDLSARKVASWPYNPEGISPWPPSPESQVVVVFDRGKRPPLWTVVDVRKR